MGGAPGRAGGPAPSPAEGHRGRRGNLDQRVAVESGRRRIGVLRRKLIDTDILVGQLDRDLELDGNEVVAPDAARASGRHERLEALQLVAAERLAHVG